jgi:AraC-like DNA-binding protein
MMIMNALLLCSTVLALFLSGLIFSKRQKSYPQYMLGTWFIFIAIHLSILYLQTINLKLGYPWPWVIGIDLSFLVLHSIWIFLYILSVVRPDLKKILNLWHLVPFIGINIILCITSYTKPGTWKTESYKQALEGTGYIDKGLEFSVLLIICLALAYLAASFWLLYRHQKNVKNIYSTTKGKDLKWLRILLISLSVVILANTIIEWLRNYFNLIPSDIGISIGYIFILLGLLYIGFNGIRQTTVFSFDESIQISKKRSDVPIRNSAKASYEPLSHENDHEDYQELLSYIENHKPYVDFDLNLLSLSAQTDIKPRHLSWLINNKSGQNFCDFINQFRIEEFKRRVREPDSKNYTLLSIAYECGFNSKATFNRVFKNRTGITPSSFYKNLDIN